MDQPSDEVPKSKKLDFVPYRTMFKLEEPLLPLDEEDLSIRQLECVNCQSILEWRLYTVAPDQFDIVCPDCHMTASEFWEGKLCMELDEDA